MNKNMDPLMPPEPLPEWHSLPVREVLSALAADHAGLTLDEAARRLEQYGPNRLPAVPKVTQMARLFLSILNLIDAAQPKNKLQACCTIPPSTRQGVT